MDYIYITAIRPDATKKKSPRSSRDSLGLIGYAVANAATRMSDKGQFQYLVGDNLI